MTEQEKSLLSGCLKGEKGARDQFVEQYSGLVYHVIHKSLAHFRTHTHHLVEDIYQEVFLAVMRDGCKKLAQFRGDRGCTLASWLRVVVARLTIDLLRKQHRPAAQVEAAAADDPGPLESIIKDEQNSLLEQVLKTLPPRDRILINLAFGHEQSPQEIAAILKTSVNAVYAQKSRILARIRETLKKTGGL